MDPVGGFRPSYNSSNNDAKQQYVRDIRHLTEFKLKYLQSELKPSDGPAALRAYLNLKDGKQRGLVAEDAYRTEELNRLKKLIDPMYMKTTKGFLERSLMTRRSDIEQQLAGTTDPTRREGIREHLATFNQKITDVGKVTSIDDFAKPELAYLKQSFDEVLTKLKPK